MLSVSLLGDFCIRHDRAPVTGVDLRDWPTLGAFLEELLRREEEST